MTGASSYSFPVLGNQEILACLNELEMQVEEAQLAKPHFDFVRQLYENLVVLLVGISREEMQQPVFNAIDALEFPELHDESIPCVVFIKNLSKLLRASGIQDFSIIKDLHKPDYARLRRNLSAIINFAKFREEKLSLFTDLQEDSESAVVSKQSLEVANTKLKEDLQRLQSARDLESSHVDALEAETCDMEEQLRSLNKEQALLQSEIRSVKQTNTDLADKASSEKFRVLNAQKARSDLRNQVVESPEILQHALKEIQSSIEEERECVKNNERRSREAGSRLESISKVEKEVSKAVKLMQDVEKEIARYKEMSKKVKAMNGKLVSSERGVIDLGATHQHLKRQSQMLTERLHRLQQQSQLKIEAAEEALEECVRNKENASAENANACAKRVNNEAVSRSLQDKISELKAGHAGELATLADKYNTLCSQVQGYHTSLVEAMEANVV